ncbi:MAG: hypothetical protein ACRD5W_16780, partial [Candidatus Acidiferrales bacterium]
MPRTSCREIPGFSFNHFSGEYAFILFYRIRDTTHHPAVPGTGFVQINGFAQSAEDPEDCYVTHGQTFCATIWDYGTVSVSVNGVSKSVTYNGNSTGASIAVALKNAFNADAGSPVSASASGTILYLTAKVGGANTNYPLSAASATA